MHTHYIMPDVSDARPTPAGCDITDEYRRILDGLGWRIGVPGRRTRRHNVRCRVNGDGYWYTQREIVCERTGETLGWREDESGPSGEI